MLQIFHLNPVKLGRIVVVVVKSYCTLYICLSMYAYVTYIHTYIYIFSHSFIYVNVGHIDFIGIFHIQSYMHLIYLCMNDGIVWHGI